MEIQRQADYYGLGYPEHREARMSPAQIAALTRGPEITPGLLNLRSAAAPASDLIAPELKDDHTGVDDVAEVFAENPIVKKKRKTSACDYCGKPGHDWDVHPEARADVAEYQKEMHRQEFPFGDYQPQDEW